jgi:nicotinate dehydrogenase subunit B
MKKQLLQNIEPERYEIHTSIEEQLSFTRREVLKLLGGGLLILVISPAIIAQSRNRQGGGNQAEQQISSWLHIGKDGTANVFTGKTEVGQNIRTSLSQVVAEELRVPMSQIKMVMADTDLTPFDMGTFGSRTTPQMAPQLRQAASAAREALLEIAAEKWGTAVSKLKVKQGQIVYEEGNITISYAELLEGKSLDRVIRTGVELTPPENWQVIGTSQIKVNAKEIVTGGHKYTSDLELPGMLYGKVLRPPKLGAALVSAEISDAENLEGVKVVRQGDFVGVTAPSEHLVNKAITLIKTEWKEISQISSKELFSHLRGSEKELDSSNIRGEKKLVAEYRISYIAHAPLEPRAAAAEWKDDKLTVYTGTQRPFGVRSELANAFRIPEEDVRVIVPDTGSGYGGKHTGEAAVEAARLARSVKRPVKLVWTREEEFTFAYFRPAGVIQIRSGLDDDGTITHWEFDNYNSGGAGIGFPYALANARTQFHRADSPLRQGSYRVLAATANNFARESHIDDMAHSVGMEPLEFRLKNLTNTRLRDVLIAATEKFGWGKHKSDSEKGFGLACGVEKGGYVATCVEIFIDKQTKEIKVQRAVTAFECGAVINPEHLKNQIEGCIVMGIGGALFEEIDFENGEILNNKFSKYRVPRFQDMPVLETVLLDRRDLPSAGAGETPIIGIAPAIGNAIYASTGERIRSLPMVRNGLKLT